MSNFRYTANIYDFGMDVNGNATAHWDLWDRGVKVAQSGGRREQCGYNAQASGPEYWLWKTLGKRYEGERVNRGSYHNMTRVNLRRVRS